jgi:hypothetical protein
MLSANQANRIVGKYPTDSLIRNKKTGEVYLLGRFGGHCHWWAMRLNPAERVRLYSLDIVQNFDLEAVHA